MYRFIIDFQVTIDREQIEHGTIGSLSGTNDYHPNEVKSAVKYHYKQSFQNAKNIAIVFIAHSSAN